MCHDSKWGCGPTCGTVAHMVGGLLWVLGILSLVVAWVATKNGMVWGLDAAHWYQDVTALALLGVASSLLAGYHARKGCGGGGEGHGEEKCGCGGGTCEHK